MNEMSNVDFQLIFRVFSCIWKSKELYAVKFINNVYICISFLLCNLILPVYFENFVFKEWYCTCGIVLLNIPNKQTKLCCSFFSCWLNEVLLNC